MTGLVEVGNSTTDIRLLKQENDLLKQQVAFLQKQLWGAKSEKGIPDHPDLFGDETFGSEPDDHPQTPEPKPRKKRKSKPKEPTPRWPEDTEVRASTMIPTEVLANPELWKKIGEERSDRLSFEPGTFYIKRVVRPKYVRSDCPADEPNPPVIAELPPQLQERAILAPELLAHIAVSKYSDHLPLERQEKIFRERYGVEISSQTMSNGMSVMADRLKPIVDLMSTTQFKGNYIQCDETPLDYLKPGNGKTAKGYMWTVNVPGGYCVYHWRNGRSEGCLRSIVPNEFEGVIQCDAYRVYQSFSNKRPGIILNGCMAHVRRKFKEAADQGGAPTQSRWVLNQIRLLYRIEKKLRNDRAGPAKRSAVRCAESLPIMNRLRKALEIFRKNGKYRPQSLMGKAISYAMNHWDMLLPWINNGSIEIDNNLVENKIRPTKLGVKNWLFIGADSAGWKSAVIYSIISSCRSFGIEPYQYLADVLNRLPGMETEKLPSLLPDQWAKAQKA